MTCDTLDLDDMSRGPTGVPVGYYRGAMTMLVLIRHGRSTANAAGILAGRAEGVELDDTGREQARALAQLFDGVTVSAAYSSPVLRCRQTAELAGLVDPVVLDALTECDYGEWTNRALSDLSQEPLWSDIQRRPSDVRFPGGESMSGMQQRMVGAVEALLAQHAADDVVAVVSHGDPIKAYLSHALGQSLDDFQRLNVAPASISIIHHAADRAPFVVCINANSDIAAALRKPAAPVIGGGDTASGQETTGHGGHT